MDMWTFRCYTSNRGDNEIQEWYESLDSAARAKVYDRVMDRLRFWPKQKWTDPYVHHLTNSDDIYSIIIKYKRIQYRITGFFIEDKSEFIMLDWFIEQGKKSYKPAIDRANARKREVLNGERATVEYSFTKS